MCSFRFKCFGCLVSDSFVYSFFGSLLCSHRCTQQVMFPVIPPALQGIGEPILFLGSTVFFAIKDAVAAARSESG